MNLRVGPVAPPDEPALAALFARIATDPSTAHFRPHPFTAEEAARKACYAGPDIYALMAFGGEGIGYGLLRGWEEGYPVPSLGIYVAPAHRGAGAARLIMDYLHLTARLRGAPAVRLKVYPDNVRARRLYQSFGYRFDDTRENGQHVGLLQL